jgi:hypothetical protein
MGQCYVVAPLVKYDCTVGCVGRRLLTYFSRDLVHARTYQWISASSYEDFVSLVNQRYCQGLRRQQNPIQTDSFQYRLHLR